jgi:hypothetical protein
MNHNPTTKEGARYAVLQRFYDDGMLKEEIITDLKLEPEQRATGIRAMVNAAFRVQPTETEETEPETRLPSAFRSMLEAARGKGSTKSEQPHTTTTRMTGIFRQIDESQFPALCDPDQCPPDFSRHCRANRPENFGKPCIYITPKNR